MSSSEPNEEENSPPIIPNGHKMTFWELMDMINAERVSSMSSNHANEQEMTNITTVGMSSPNNNDNNTMSSPITSSSHSMEQEGVSSSQHPSSSAHQIQILQHPHPELTDELRLLGFTKIPTAAEARAELQRNYTTRILTPAESFHRWYLRTYPPYQKHKNITISSSSPSNTNIITTKNNKPSNSRKRGATTDLTTGTPAKTPKRVKTSKQSKVVSKEEDDDEEEEEEETIIPTSLYSDPNIKNLAAAYAFAIAIENTPPNIYTVKTYTNSYKRAYDLLASPHKSAWETYVSPTVNANQAKLRANKAGRAAIKDFGGLGAVMRLGLQLDLRAATAMNLSLQQWLAKPRKWRHGARSRGSSGVAGVVPGGYTKEQWNASVKRTRHAFYITRYREWEVLVKEEGMEVDVAKAEAARRAKGYVGEVGSERIRERALMDDLAKAEGEGIGLGEWLRRWSDKVEANRVKKAARKGCDEEGGDEDDEEDEEEDDDEDDKEEEEEEGGANEDEAKDKS